MLVHGLLVESVDLRRLGGSAGGNNVLGDNFDGCQVAPGEKKIGPLSRKGACDSAADRASGSVDHRNLVRQHHLWFLSVPGWSHPARLMSVVTPRPPHELRPTAETHLRVAAFSPSVDVRIVRAVDDADT